MEIPLATVLVVLLTTYSEDDPAVCPVALM